MTNHLTEISDAPKVVVCSDRKAMGQAAAEHVMDLLEHTINKQGHARVIFACAPSQNEFLESLVSFSPDRVLWQHVTAFHMDEYVGLPAFHPASFRQYLHSNLISKAPVGRFHPILGESADLSGECARYTKLIHESPIDLICLGIGENGHLAFNDPPVADFADSSTVKVVELDATCRQQQVNDGCFPSLSDVPRHALTLTLPVFRNARHLSVVVPGPRKAEAVKATCHGPVSTACPATLLRTRRDATLFLDQASAALL